MAVVLDPAQCKIALLAGGKSGERQVSINSGKGAKQALEEAGFTVTMLDPAKRQDMIRLAAEDFDVAFLCLHGIGGEDGTIQGMLEVLGIPYTGSGVAASAIAINKSKAKLVYTAAGIPTPQSVTLTKGQTYDVDEIANKVTDHCVVKACSEGSTIGIYMVEKRCDLAEAIENAFQYDTQVLIEQFVAGDEFTVAVIGNEEIEPLPVINIVPVISGFYDFEAKYAPGGSKHLCPAPIPEDLSDKLQELAAAAHKALGCAGVSRTDFIVDAEGNPWVLETNTIPGMTATSLLPDAAAAQGYTFAELCTKLVKFALEK